MSETASLAERVTLLEEEVRRLSRQIGFEKVSVSGRTNPDFLERFAGIFGDDPTFPEAVRLGQEWRNTDKPQEENSSAP